MKQRIITLLLAAALCLSLAACGDETDSLDSDSESFGSEVAAGGQEGIAGDNGSDEAGAGTSLPNEVDGMTLGTGLEVGEVVAQLDENPDRAIRRSTKPIVQTVGTMLDGTPLSNDFYLYRNTLNDHGKQVYDLIRSALLKGDATIPMTLSITPEDAVTVFNMVVYDNPELFWTHTSLSYSYNNYNCVTSITPKYHDLVYDIPGYTAQLENALADALADMWSLDSDAERVKYAHDYLTNINDYIAGAPYNQSAYSAIVLNDTVCAGYAKAFQYMMHRMGIPCAHVVGDAYGGAGSGAHSWNIVEIDGEFYAMDVTWDDPVGNAPNTYYYNYFNLTDNQMSQNRTRWDIAAGLPWATGTTYTFQNAFGTYGTDFGAVQGYLPDTSGGDDQPTNGGDGSGDNPYLPSGDGSSGDNPYLPSGGGDTSGGDWEDYDWNDWSYDDYSEFGYDWWNALDESWTLEDWTDYGDGMWEIWDEETQCYYFYDESDGTFGCMDAYDETFYLLDFETGEWIPLD